MPRTFLLPRWSWGVGEWSGADVKGGGWVGVHSSSVLPSSPKYRSIVLLALLFLCLSTAKYWIMSFHTICPQASLKIHEWAILWGTGAIVCPSRPGTKDLTRNTWRGASVVISQTDLAEALVSAARSPTEVSRGTQPPRNMYHQFRWPDEVCNGPASYLFSSWEDAVFS